MFYSAPSRYALRALSYIAHQGEGVVCGAEEVSKQEDIPKHFLSKILQKLVEAQILRSLKGPGGGFVFEKRASEISLMQVVSIFDPMEDTLKECAIGWKKCSDRKPCVLHPIYKPLREKIRNYLESVTLLRFKEAEFLKVVKTK